MSATLEVHLTQRLAIIEAVRRNPHLAHIIECAKNMTNQQIETACRVVCNMFAVKDEYHAG